MDTEFQENYYFEKRKFPVFGIILLLIVIGFSLVIIFSPGQEIEESGSSWVNDGCIIECHRDDFTAKPLLVISFDGFKQSYIKKNIIKTLKEMAKCGTTAEYMYGTYPTKTFPNHYSIATGLYPESHGIIDNIIYDDRMKSRFVDVRRDKDEQYYNGIPIWNVLEQRNITTACLFWPGCDSLIKGMQPTYNLKYNRLLPYRDRIDQISKELEEIDSTLDYLFNTLHKLGILHCINIIVLSDHGMQKIHHRFYFDQIIDMQHILFANGVVGQIYFPNVTNSELQDKIMETMENLKCENNTFYRVYDKRRIPIRYHFSKSHRIGDIIIDGQLGAIFYENYAADYNKTYDDGYDFILPPMHAIFYAYGPNIVRSRVLKPFQNIELFNLMQTLLNINSSQSPPNNGTNGRLNSVLDNTAINLPHRSKPLKECMINDNIEEKSACLLDISLLISGNEEVCYLSDCSSISQSALIQRRESNSTVALIERISTSLSASKSESRIESAEWIPTSLSVKGTSDLKVNLYSDFVKGHFIDLEMITSKYVELFGEIVVISGPIYDFDDKHSELHLQRNLTPSHIFRVIFRCKDSQWLKNELQCEDINSLDVRSFILPNVPNDYNCLDPLSYLSENKARLRDIELLTGFEFLPTTLFPEEEIYDDEFSIILRTMLPENLWIKEKIKWQK